MAKPNHQDKSNVSSKPVKEKWPFVPGDIILFEDTDTETVDVGIGVGMPVARTEWNNTAVVLPIDLEITMKHRKSHIKECD